MSVFALLRRIEFLTRPAPSLAHDYDVPVQDVEDEVWEHNTYSVRMEIPEGMTPEEFVAAHQMPIFEPAATTPAADAEAVETGSPRRSPASALSFADYVVPAITDVLAEHQFHMVLDQCGCGEYMDDYDWREHVAEFLAERIETCLLNRFPEGK